MGNYDVRIGEANSVDALSIAYRLREEDIREAADLGGLSPKDAVQLSMQLSRKAFIAYVNERPEVIFGVGHSNSLGVGHPWLLSTEVIKLFPVGLSKSFRVYIKQFLEMYPVLTNLMDARNRVHEIWLKRMGFSFIKDYPDYGPGKILARQFILCA